MAKQEFIKDSPFHHRTREGFVGIFAALLSIFFIIPIFLDSFYGHVAIQIGFFFLILSTLYLVQAQKKILLLGMAFGFPYIFFIGLGLWTNSLHFTLIAYVFSYIYLIFTIILMTKKIMRADNIDTNLLFGAITIYFLVGILWAKIYFALNALLPNAFHGLSSLNTNTNTLDQASKIQFDFLYYSFTTLSTLGLGDIAPIQPIAKSLTMLEALFGQLFVAIFISKMVSVWQNPTKVR